MEGLITSLTVIGLYALAIAFFVFILTAISRDACRRGKSPLLVFIACVLFFPWGLVAWLVFPPDPFDPPGGQFDLRDYRSQ